MRLLNALNRSLFLPESRKALSDKRLGQRRTRRAPHEARHHQALESLVGRLRSNRGEADLGGMMLILALALIAYALPVALRVHDDISKAGWADK